MISTELNFPVQLTSQFQFHHHVLETGSPAHPGWFTKRRHAVMDQSSTWAIRSASASVTVYLHKALVPPGPGSFHPWRLAVGVSGIAASLWAKNANVRCWLILCWYSCVVRSDRWELIVKADDRDDRGIWTIKIIF